MLEVRRAQGKLVVKAAFCGRSYFVETIDGDGILGATTRLYKYLVPAYADQFAARLKLGLWTRLSSSAGKRCRCKSEPTGVSVNSTEKVSVWKGLSGVKRGGL